MAVALVAAAAVVALSAAALYAANAPELLSSLIQPVSLLLLPGFAVAMAVSGNHDFSPQVAVLAAFGFYWVAIFVWMWVRTRGARLAGRSAR